MDLKAKRLYFSAIMEMPVSPSPMAGRLASGHFYEQKRYSTWRPRGTKDWLLIYTVAGSGRFGFQKGEMKTRPGDAVLIKPATPHDYGLEDRFRQWELLWAHFIPRPDFLPILHWPESAPGILKISIVDGDIKRQVEAGLKIMHSFNTGPLRRAEYFAVNALEEVLLQLDVVNPRDDIAPMDDRIRRALDYLHQRVASPVDLDAVARHCHLSLSRFAHLFRTHMGKAPRQYLENLKMDRARQLLELTQQRVSEIAFGLGFESPFYFTRRFTRHTGLSPRAYRSTHTLIRPRVVE